MAAPPVIPDLPPAPTRSDGGADFTPKADAMIAALQPTITAMNTSVAYINDTAVDATEALEAAGIAVAARDVATAAANNAAASAAAAESAPGSIGNLALIHSLTIGMMRRF